MFIVNMLSILVLNVLLLNLLYFWLVDDVTLYNDTGFVR